MALCNLLRTCISFISKDIPPTVCVRTFCSQIEETREKTRFVERGKVQEYPIETCIRYMDSKAYKSTYGEQPVWHTYVRNFRGARPPPTRKSCIVGGKITTGSPCPICRDHYLKTDYRNVKLLQQFISPYGGDILETSKTGVCQKQQHLLKVAIKKAQDYGYLTFPVPHRHYNYRFYK